jgi:hypothetical protein
MASFARRARRGLLWLAIAAMLSAVIASPASADERGQLIHEPDLSGTESNIYARVIELAHAGARSGRLLMTFERDNPTGGPIELLIKSSDDAGASWTTLSTVTDGRSGPGRPVSRMWQPELFEFPRQLGPHPAGTIMLVANLVPADGSVTEFFSWYSHDQGASWTPGGVIQRGGTFGRGIWEPHLILDRAGNLQMYFADERSAPEHSQMIVHLASEDGGRTWGPVQRAVASAVSGERPGMPSLTRIGERGEFVLSFEVCGRAHCEVRVKTSTNGSNWGAAADLGHRVVTRDGRYPGHSPFISWIPTGPRSGHLALVAQHVFSTVGDGPAPEDYRAVFLNSGRNLDLWDWAPTPWTVSNASPGCNANYSPHLMPVGQSGDLRLTAPTSVGDTGTCGEATGVASVGTLPFAADFERRATAGWIGYGGSWTTDGDTLVQGDPEGFPKAVTGSTGWTDYTVAGQLKIGSGTVDAGFLTRVSDPAVGPDSHHGYYVGLDPSSDRLFISRQDYAYLELAGTRIAGGIEPGTWYRARIELSTTRKGTVIDVQLSPSVGGGSTSLQARDPYNSFASGMVGLRTHAGTAEFRTISVTPGG